MIVWKKAKRLLKKVLKKNPFEKTPRATKVKVLEIELFSNAYGKFDTTQLKSFYSGEVFERICDVAYGAIPKNNSIEIIIGGNEFERMENTETKEFTITISAIAVKDVIHSENTYKVFELNLIDGFKDDALLRRSLDKIIVKSMNYFTNIDNEEVLSERVIRLN